MHTLLIAAALCVFVQVTDAQCVGSNLPAQDAHNGAHAIKAMAVVTPAGPVAATKGELITAAAAGTRDEPGTPREPKSAARSAHKVQQDTQDDEDHPRRGGTAMLLAALALMSGIALRRYTSGSQ